MFDSICRVHPAALINVDDLIFWENGHIHDLASEHRNVCISADFVRTVVEVVYKIAQYVAHNFGHCI